MTETTIRRISAAAARPLRQSLLRQNAKIEDLVYPGDDEPDTLHLGLFFGDEHVGIASVYRQTPPASLWPHPTDLATTWRLRAMATQMHIRNQGWGGKLLEAAIGYAAAQGGAMLWCDARVKAVNFYARYNFNQYGEIYNVPDVGPHYFMWRALSPADVPLAQGIEGL
jgi:predicted GNAT family N-acyltransferase